METTKMPSRGAVYATTGVIVLLAIGLASVTHADTGKNGVGVFIGTNGNVRVHGATVTATSSDGLMATTNLNGNTITWDVDATSTTRFGKLGTGVSALMNVAIGDVVSFFGKLSGSGSTLEVDAYAIKNHDNKSTTTAKEHNKKSLRERLSGNSRIRAAFDNFLDSHENLRARFEARFGAKND
jgi:hypothetical protein